MKVFKTIRLIAVTTLITGVGVTIADAQRATPQCQRAQAAVYGTQAQVARGSQNLAMMRASAASAGRQVDTRALCRVIRRGLTLQGQFERQLNARNYYCGTSTRPDVAQRLEEATARMQQVEQRTCQ